jgi:regulator of sirC expression with transglutaminase-like and TPR domain
MLAAQRRGEMLFAEEMRKPDAEVDFVRAAAFVAMHRRPELSRVEDAVEELDELAAELQKLLPPNEEDRFPLRTLKTISRFMFEDLGFRGDDETFYDPRNSCLDEVLARRVGIPITLSLIYMELAKRVGMPMVGVNLPSRFMIRPVVEDMEVLVDCFNKGEIVFRGGRRGDARQVLLRRGQREWSKRGRRERPVEWPERRPAERPDHHRPRVLRG